MVVSILFLYLHLLLTSRIQFVKSTLMRVIDSRGYFYTIVSGNIKQFLLTNMPKIAVSILFLYLHFLLTPRMQFVKSTPMCVIYGRGYFYTIVSGKIKQFLLTNTPIMPRKNAAK